MNNKSPAFQFYPGDFLSDENVISMTFEERGIYITLLCSCWIQGSIPADPSKILRLLPGFTGDELPMIIMDRFQEMEGNPERLINNRLEKERQKQEDFREIKSESGKRGAQKRWENHEKKPSDSATLGNRPSNGCAIVLPMAKNSSSVFSLQSSSSLNLNTHEIYENFEQDWNLYPRKAGNKIKARVCYHKSVGKDPDKRKLFLEKMQAYVSNTDIEYLKHGETFFRNWQALVVDTVKSRKNGNKGPTPMAQALIGRGEFVDKVLNAMEVMLATPNAYKTEELAGKALIDSTPEEDKEAVSLILHDFYFHPEKEP